MHSLAERLKQQARSLGFDLVGITHADPADTFARLESWLDAGFAAGMEYMRRHREARRHPDSVLPGVQSVVMLAMRYRPPEEPQHTSQPLAGRVARYALGADYHEVIRERLNRLLVWVREQDPTCVGRGVVDTAPLLERDFARRAGLGWFGKNTMLIDRRLGSYLFLAALLLSVELPSDPPHFTSHCGTCTACLDACPTQAFPAPGVLDARRCISYLTIEHRGSIPEELRPALGDWVFGCDVCQEVCPWNRKAPPAREPAFAPTGQGTWLALEGLFTLDEVEFRRRFRGTALARAGRRGILRNAAIVLANRADPAGLPILHAMTNDPDPVLREVASWASTELARRTGCNNPTA